MLVDLIEVASGLTSYFHIQTPRKPYPLAMAMTSKLVRRILY